MKSFRVFTSYTEIIFYPSYVELERVKVLESEEGFENPSRRLRRNLEIFNVRRDS